MAGKGFTMKKNWDNPREYAMPAEARVPAEMRLGTVVVAPATVLAPMVGVTDTVFRRFIRHASLFTASQVSESRPGAPLSDTGSSIDAAVTNEQSGCGLLMTEFTSADGLARMRETKRQRYLTFYEDEHPIGAQLFGANPETLAEAARIVEETGFDLVDLNLGCPAKRVVGSNAYSGNLQGSAQGGHNSLHSEVPAGLERRRDCLPGVGADGRGRGTEWADASRPHPRAGL